VNEFTRKVVEILVQHPVNVERRKRDELQTNILLLRDAGSELPKVEPITKKYGLRFSLI